MKTDATDNKVFHDGIGRAAAKNGVAPESESVIIRSDGEARRRELKKIKDELLTLARRIEKLEEEAA